MVASSKAGVLTDEVTDNWGKLPRKHFNRKKKRVKGHFLYQAFAEVDEDVEDVSLNNVNRAIPEVIQALEYLQAAVKPSDDFDYDAFMDDVSTILKPKFRSKKEIQDETDAHYARLDAETTQELRDAPIDLSCKIHTFAVDVEKEVSRQYTTDRTTFVNQFTCISDWFEVLLRNVYRGAVQQLLIKLTPDIEQPDLLAAVLTWPFQFETFQQREGVEKKRMIADTMREALTWFAHTTDQDPQPIDAAYQEIKANDFFRKGRLKNSVASPNGKLVARLEFEHELEGVELFVVFTKPRSNKGLGRASMGMCPYRPWLLGNLHKYASWKRSHFHLDVPPSADWSASVNATKVIKEAE